MKRSSSGFAEINALQPSMLLSASLSRFPRADFKQRFACRHESANLFPWQRCCIASVGTGISKIEIPPVVGALAHITGGLRFVSRVVFVTAGANSPSIQ